MTDKFASVCVPLLKCFDTRDLISSPVSDVQISDWKLICDHQYKTGLASRCSRNRDVRAVLHHSEQLWVLLRLHPLIAFHYPRNLWDFLVQAALTFMPCEPPGDYPHAAFRCKTCYILVIKEDFLLPHSWTVFLCETRASYKSSNIYNLFNYMQKIWLTVRVQNGSAGSPKGESLPIWHH